MNLNGKPLVVLDLETAHSADDCLHCGKAQQTHLRAPVSGHSERMVCFAGSTGKGFERIGWDNLAALGLSIGCYWDYNDSRIHWFDVSTLRDTVQHFVNTKPLLVSFNGIQFDFKLMALLLRQQAERMLVNEFFQEECDNPSNVLLDIELFEALSLTSYDLLHEIWKIDSRHTLTPGLNSLDVLSQKNGLGQKLSNGAEAPRNWRTGRYADVLNYCQDDVLKTKALFELICDEYPILRGNGTSLRLPRPLLDTL